MTVLLDTDVHVHYGFLWLTAADDALPDGDPRAGQSNGLCGAAVPGALGMVTGLHTGSVPVRVMALDDAPPVDDAWEEVVEVSFQVRGREYLLSAFEEFHDVLLPWTGDVRARWCARGMQAARDADTRLEDEPALDAYLLQLWPAAPAPGAVLRQTSAVAAYWHDVARNSAPPPTAEQVAEQAAEQQRRHEREERRREAAELLASWGARLPTARVRALGGRARELGQDARGLLDAVTGLDDAALQRLTAWVCRTSCQRAGLEELDWVAPALAALETGRPLPPPFDDDDAPWQKLDQHWGAGADLVEGATVLGSDSTARTPLAPEAAALDALQSTRVRDPLQAAVGAIVGASCSYARPEEWYGEVARRLGLPA
ncbi:MAG: hypothetical protein JWM64_1518 [Frankiales bacterium]|nr:hypothetical protein [Frankiales bacterium]